MIDGYFVMNIMLNTLLLCGISLGICQIGYANPEENLNRNFNNTPKVAVIEEDFDQNLEPFLAQAIESSQRELNTHAQRETTHGSHVTGIILHLSEVRHQNNAQIIVPVKVRCTYDLQNLDEITKAFREMTNSNEIKIVNISRSLNYEDVDRGLETLQPSKEYFLKKFLQAIKDTANSGKLILMSAGNKGEKWGKQAWHKRMIPLIEELDGKILLVGAHNTTTDKLADFSNKPNSQIKPFFVTAPGCNIQSWDALYTHEKENGIGLIEKSGTSMAAPYVAGVAQCIMYQYPQLSVDNVSQILRGCANPKNEKGTPLENSGLGVIYRSEALKAAKFFSQRKPTLDALKRGPGY